VADTCGQARALTVLSPVRRGREAELRAELEALPDGGQSPLARLPGTHFARWLVLPGRGLLFSATHDSRDSDYLEEIRARLPEEADAVWRHCEGYPGMGEEFPGYLRRHRVETDLFVAAYPEASLDDVHEALAVRSRLIGLVLRARSLSPEELRAAFREERLA
jgi:hypothetical protein